MAFLPTKLKINHKITISIQKHIKPMVWNSLSRYSFRVWTDYYDQILVVGTIKYLLTLWKSRDHWIANNISFSYLARTEHIFTPSKILEFIRQSGKIFSNPLKQYLKPRIAIIYKSCYLVIPFFLSGSNRSLVSIFFNYLKRYQGLV